MIKCLAQPASWGAIKIGMIGSPAIVEAVADRLSHEDARMPLVFDPVMVATSGAALADTATIAAFERCDPRCAAAGAG